MAVTRNRAGIAGSNLMRLFQACLFLTASSHAWAVELAPKLPPSTMASIVISRSQESSYDPQPALIALDGTQVSSLMPGETYSISVPFGSVTISVSNPSNASQSTLQFSADPGGSYQFLISPRQEDAASKRGGGIADRFEEGKGPFVIIPLDLE